MGLLALPVALGLFLMGQSKVVETQAWPVIRKVALRLQTDAEAGRLYRANPALGRVYADEDVFLDRVRAHRAQFASLPDLPPGADLYECFAGPNGFRASLQGSGGVWATFEVRQNILLEKVPGEGILRLEFSPTKEPNDRERRALQRARAESDWRRFRDICALLATEAGTRALWQREPGLRAAYPGEAALLAFAADIRPRLQPLPDMAGHSKVRLRRQVQSGPQGETVRLGYPFPGGTLTAVWSGGQLTGLEFAPR
ncbi:MAG TPA: hypothetical protein VJ463_05260 [Geothrix sp.]|nr:hypothetical protein [Geothrix sp.]